jgi:hypothetical protein
MELNEVDGQFNVMSRTCDVSRYLLGVVPSQG